MKHAVRLALLAATFTAAVAHAQVYVEGAYTPTTIKVDDASIKPALVTGTVGYGVHPNLALEGTLGLGAKKVSSDDDTFKYTNTVGIYLKPRYQVNESFEVYGRVGFNAVGIKVSNSGDSLNDASGSAAWGLGANLSIDKNLYLTGSYNQLYKKDAVKIDGFSLGLGYKF